MPPSPDLCSPCSLFRNPRSTPARGISEIASRRWTAAMVFSGFFRRGIPPYLAPAFNSAFAYSGLRDTSQRCGARGLPRIRGDRAYVLVSFARAPPPTHTGHLLRRPLGERPVIGVGRVAGERRTWMRTAARGSSDFLRLAGVARPGTILHVRSAFRDTLPSSFTKSVCSAYLGVSRHGRGSTVLLLLLSPSRQWGLIIHVLASRRRSVRWRLLWCSCACLCVVLDGGRLSQGGIGVGKRTTVRYRSRLLCESPASTAPALVTHTHLAVLMCGLDATSRSSLADPCLFPSCGFRRPCPALAA